MKLEPNKLYYVQGYTEIKSDASIMDAFKQKIKFIIGIDSGILLCLKVSDTETETSFKCFSLSRQQNIYISLNKKTQIVEFCGDEDLWSKS